MGVQICTTTLEINTAVPQETGNQSASRTNYTTFRNIPKGKQIIGAGLQLQRLNYYHLSRKHGGVMVLKKELRVLHLEWQAARRECHTGPFEYLEPLSPLPVTHVLLHDYTYSNKATPPNSTTPNRPVGAIFIQTTTMWIVTVKSKISKLQAIVPQRVVLEEGTRRSG